MRLRFATSLRSLGRCTFSKIVAKWPRICILTNDEPARIQAKAPFRRDPRTARQKRAGAGAAPLRRAEARGSPAALRFSPGAGWSPQELGRAERTVARPEQQAAGGHGRRSSA